MLNQKENVRASEDVRSNIIELARELDYRPHDGARSLRSGVTKIVVIAVWQPEYDYLDYYQGALEQLALRLGEVGYHLLVKVVRLVGCKRRNAASCDGPGCRCIVLWGRAADVAGTASLLEEIGVSVVVKGRFEKEHSQWAQVDFNHEAMTEHAVHFLAENGHERIAYMEYSHPEAFAAA